MEREEAVTPYSDTALLAALIYGEARGETLVGKISVACVVRNRVLNPKWWGRSWKEVILKRSQFSCMTPVDKNYDDVLGALEGKFANEISYRECRWAAVGAVEGWYRDITKGANHYHTEAILPHWAKGKLPTVHIGNHLFYTL